MVFIPESICSCGIIFGVLRTRGFSPLSGRKNMGENSGQEWRQGGTQGLMRFFIVQSD